MTTTGRRPITLDDLDRDEPLYLVRDALQGGSDGASA